MYGQWLSFHGEKLKSRVYEDGISLLNTINCFSTFIVDQKNVFYDKNSGL